VAISFPSSPVAGTSVYSGGRQWTYDGTSWNLQLSGSSSEFQWTKTAVGGETTLSGASDSGTTLTYAIGTEEVYLNGVLMQRNTDYTASTGTTLVFPVALTASDVVTLISFGSFQLGSANIATGTEPTTYTPGMVWVNTTGSALGYTFIRWRLTIASSTSTLSGLDDNSVTLAYTPGYEEVYINGALITRGLDYTATNGTSISLTVGVVPGDVVEVFNQSTLTNSTAIPNTTVTAKGDLIVGTSSSAVTRLPIGSNNYLLTADSSQTNGLNWEQYPPSGTSLPTGLYAGQMFYLTTANALYIYNGSAWGVLTPSPIASVTGGTLYSDSTYYYRAFTSTANLVVSNASLTADVLVVGGGAAGGHDRGGGGGAGGVIYFASQALAAGTYLCTIGGGGAGTGGSGNSGYNSTFASLTAAIGGGGGIGADVPPTSAQNGGSGGGAAGNGSGNNGTNVGGSTTQTGTGATAYYGNIGGNSIYGGPSYPGGGGGGAGAAGQSAPNGGQGGAGGNGTSVYSSWLSVTGYGQNVSGTYYIAGGGGGATYNYSSPGTAGVGGYGGGGAGQIGNSQLVGVYGATNSGSGGGGGSGGPTNAQNGGNGGSGLIIVRYTRSQVGG